MIISLRGTNGAGKSTIVRQIMKSYSTMTQIEYPGRRHPTGYILTSPGLVPLFVPGHYEIANGGIDTLQSLDYAYSLIETHAGLGMNVLAEGKNMSDGCARLHAMHLRGMNVVAAHIDLSVKECTAAVRSRGHKIKIETIQKLHEKTIREMKKFAEDGVEIFSGSRGLVFEFVRAKLGVIK